MERSRSSHAAHLRMLLMVVLIVAVVMSAAGTASAGPPTPILPLTDLQTMLDGGPVAGTMKTTMVGTAPVDIPVTILAVTSNGYRDRLIMFECADARIEHIGGIAAGMSGSPVYVDDAGGPLLVGAVSWGEEFSLNGAGLATPIEEMVAIQDTYAPAEKLTATVTAGLDQPVRLSSGETVRSIVLAPTNAAARTAAASTTRPVMHPLGLAEIGGLLPGSVAYNQVAARLEQTGLTVKPAQAMAGAALVTPDLDAGSPCGVLISTGSYWLGVMGTVTYRDGDDVLLFGHPMLPSNGWYMGAGPIEGILTGATVDTIWPSSYGSWVASTPADAKGVALQDRPSGVLAELGDAPATFPITVSATADGGGAANETTHMGRWFASFLTDESNDWGDPNGEWVSDPVAAGLYHAYGSDLAGGSVETTTTVVVSDGASSWTITRDNVWDGAYDYAVPTLGALDAGSIVGSLLNDPYGLRHPTIESVDVSAQLSTATRRSILADVDTPRALKPGTNTVIVSYYDYGAPGLKTLPVTLTIPAGTSLSGTLSVSPAASPMDPWYPWDEDAPTAPQSTADVVAEIAADPANDALSIAYTTESADPDDWYGPDAAAEATVRTGRIFDDALEKSTTAIFLRAVMPTVPLGSPILVTGMIPDATKSIPVKLYAKVAGKPEPALPVATVKATASGGVATFFAMLPPSKHTEVITAEATLDADSLPGAAMRTVKVRAGASLSAVRSAGHTNVVVRVRPADTGGKAQVQRMVSGHWVLIATLDVKAGVAQGRVSAPVGAHLRARFKGNALNAASAWAPATVH